MEKILNLPEATFILNLQALTFEKTYHITFLYKKSTKNFEFITLILNTIYKDSCSFIQSYYDETVEQWNTDNNPIYFGNLIATLCTKKYDLKQFCKDYLKVEGVQKEERPKSFYKTLSMDMWISHEMSATLVKFSLRNEVLLMIASY